MQLLELLKTHDIKLIIGLGNPGSEYANTRHNAGIWLIDKLCDYYQVSLKNQANLQCKTADIGGIKAAVSLSFMNNSGIPTSKLTNYFGIDGKNVCVVHDELDVSPGIIKFKVGGGLRGHNGLRSIASHLSTPDFCRIMVGIGRPATKDMVSKYVLSPPNKTDFQKIDECLMDAIHLGNNIEFSK